MYKNETFGAPNLLAYSGIEQQPYHQPVVWPSSPIAPHAPYYGEQLAALTSMTPFMAGQYVPVTPVKRLTHSQNVYGRAYGFFGKDTKKDGFIDNLTGEIKQFFDEGAYQVKMGLKSGDKGADVVALQQALIANGYSVGSAGADGDFGGGTEAALKSFQAANGIAITGIVDSATAAKFADPKGRKQEAAAAKESGMAALTGWLNAQFAPTPVATPVVTPVEEEKSYLPYVLGGAFALVVGVVAYRVVKG